MSRCVKRSLYGKTEYCLGDSSKRKNACSVLTLSNIHRALSGLTPRRLVKLWRSPPKNIVRSPGFYHTTFVVCWVPLRNHFRLFLREPATSCRKNDPVKG